MAMLDAICKMPATPPLVEEREQNEWAKANLDALAALLNVGDNNDSFQILFQALKVVFACDRALILEDADDAFHCIAAEPAMLAGRRWPGQSLREFLHVQAASAGGVRNAQDQTDFLSNFASLQESALCLPISVSNRPALLVLLRPSKGLGFSEYHITVAKQYATVAMATLVARKAHQLEAENRNLKAIVEQTPGDRKNPQQSSNLLKEIIDELPISLTVQDNRGRFVLANAMAAAHLAIPAETLIGASPGDFLSEQDAANRQQWEQSIFQRGEMVAVENNLSGEKGERTWVTLHKPVRILDQTLMISSSIDITAHKQVERELLEHAHSDKLTGLPDRVLIQERVEAIIRNYGDNHSFALAFIDLDNFKHINDYYNHAVGDALLVKIGQRVTSQLRPGDVLARISGDEFLLLLDPFEGEHQLRSQIDGILKALKQPFHIDAFEVFGSCSVGISIYPDHGRDYDSLRRNADSAMYRAKREAKGGAIFFDFNMAEALAARMQDEQRLRLAIRDRKFCCAFQPKVDVHTQQVIGFETLVRWRDDDGEIHPPSEFIGLAIELGLIDPITNFMLEEAVNSMDRLDAAFGSETSLSINVATKQANDLQFMKSFAQALSDSNRADRIIIELTEDAFISKGSFQTQSLPILREIGVRISIDDFGTGYSSLSTLADITADEIKIDRSFISGIHQRPRNQSVLRAIESLGRALGMTIVAEGVETYEELAYLHAATRIRYVQGFYFAKPFYLETLADAADVVTRVREVARRPSEAQRIAPSRLAVPARLGG